jgi:hypothetical protein
MFRHLKHLIIITIITIISRIAQINKNSNKSKLMSDLTEKQISIEKGGIHKENYK